MSASTDPTTSATVASTDPTTTAIVVPGLRGCGSAGTGSGRTSACDDSSTTRTGSGCAVSVKDGPGGTDATTTSNHVSRWCGRASGDARIAETTCWTTLCRRCVAGLSRSSDSSARTSIHPSSPVGGRWPVSAAATVAAKANASASGVGSGKPPRISGAAYGALRPTLPVASVRRVSPRSTSTAEPSDRTTTLAGLTSPCATGTWVDAPECISSSAAATVRRGESRSCAEAPGRSRSHWVKVEPSMLSMTT